MQTSNFWHFSREPGDPRIVSISTGNPEWFQGRRYPALAPRWNMLKMDEATYREEYRKILDKLDPQKVFDDLGEDAILLCWEKPGAFCHRRLVAEWLEEKLGVKVPEFVPEPLAERTASRDYCCFLLSPDCFSGDQLKDLGRWVFQVGRETFSYDGHYNEAKKKALEVARSRGVRAVETFYNPTLYPRL